MVTWIRWTLCGSCYETPIPYVHCTVHGPWLHLNPDHGWPWMTMDDHGTNIVIVGGSPCKKTKKNTPKWHPHRPVDYPGVLGKRHSSLWPETWPTWRKFTWRKVWLLWPGGVGWWLANFSTIWGVSINGVPQARWMVYFMESPTKMNDDWGYPHRKPKYDHRKMMWDDVGR